MSNARLFAAFALLTFATGPDEGQWLPQQVLEMDWGDLRARGMELSKDQFWNPEKGGVLSAAVQIGGCSASFVSPKGLVITNHHCGFSAIQQLSSIERNYLSDGFVAEAPADELRAPGMVVFVVRRIRDVTEEIHAAQASAKNGRERWHLTERAIQRLVKEGEQEPNTVCHVASFLEGEQYHLYYRTRITDVRLVYAPPRSVGEFGGEVDNWEWPRHTGDFAIFRAWVAPDGTPRQYSPDNVPYEPDHYLHVATDGVHANDLVLILGYPGRTERYLTSTAVQDRQTITFPMRHRLFTQFIDILEKVGASDPRKALAYASLVKSLANAQKNALGMIKGLARNGVVARKLAEEQAFTSWVAQSEERRRRYGEALRDVVELDLEARKTAHKDPLISLLGSPALSPLLGALMTAVTASDSDSDEATRERSLRQLGSPRLDRDFDAVQRPTLEVLLEEARSAPADQRLAGLEVFDDAEGDAPTADLVAAMLAESEMLDTEKRVALFRAGPTAVAASDDPLVVLARGLAAERHALIARGESQRGRRLVVGQNWIAAQQEWRGQSFYPDANSTLRVSIATVKGYAPRDGVINIPHTTVQGILDKETGEAPFACPRALLDAAAARTSSSFFDAKIGDVPVCFLADGDTTGGNSGSPVINGRGELVGLNFDRVFENVAGDYGWRPERSRNISVDIRYVLWILEQVLPAPRLLAELTG